MVVSSHAMFIGKFADLFRKKFQKFPQFFIRSRLSQHLSAEGFLKTLQVASYILQDRL
jgi:hypothetical protein